MARPKKLCDGSSNLFDWECAIPVGNDLFKLHMVFDHDYPFTPPKCFFASTMAHPHIDEMGNVALEVLDRKNWKPTTVITQILLAIQDLLMEQIPSE